MVFVRLRDQVAAGPVGRWREAYEKLKEFCRGLGGVLTSLVETGIEKPGEKLFSVSCLVPRRLSNDELASAIAELRTGLSGYMEEVLHELGSFELVEEVPSGGRVVKTEPLSDVVRVYSSRVAEYDVDPGRVEYVYPDAVEDYTEGREGYIEVKAFGSKRAFREGRLKAYSDGWLVIREPTRRETVKRLLDEFDEMLEDILRNPRNFFKFRGE